LTLELDNLFIVKLTQLNNGYPSLFDRSSLPFRFYPTTVSGFPLSLSTCPTQHLPLKPPKPLLLPLDLLQASSR
jgi:hypothetical protein